MENTKGIQTAILCEDDDDREEREMLLEVESNRNFGTKRRKRPNPSNMTAYIPVNKVTDEMEIQGKFPYFGVSCGANPRNDHTFRSSDAISTLTLSTFEVNGPHGGVPEVVFLRFREIEIDGKVGVKQRE